MRDDRSLPVTALHRFNYAVPATPKYNEAARMGAGPFLRTEKNLKPVPEDNKGLAKLSTEVRNNMGFQRKNKFCGGMSKPYKKNPLKRTVGVGTKSIKERVQEYGEKQKAENSVPKPSISKKMRPIPVSHTISSNIKKKPALPRKTKYKKK